MGEQVNQKGLCEASFVVTTGWGTTKFLQKEVIGLFE